MQIKNLSQIAARKLLNKKKQKQKISTAITLIILTSLAIVKNIQKIAVIIQEAVIVEKISCRTPMRLLHLGGSFSKFGVLASIPSIGANTESLRICKHILQ